MKLLIYRLLIFSPVCLIAFYTKPLYLIINNQYQKQVAGKEIYFAINKSNKIFAKKKVLLGDSVARQFFDCYNDYDSINSFATNQAISLAGQYIILHNFLTAGNDIDTMILLLNPFSFSNNLDQVYTYHYFIKPFYIKKNWTLLSNDVHRQIKKIPYYFLAREPYILTSNWAPDLSGKRLSSNELVNFLSPISVYYLEKMLELSEKNRFAIKVIPTPVNIKFKTEVENLKQNMRFKNNCLQQLFSCYFSSIVFLDNSEFSDEIHLIESKKYANLFNEI